MPESLVLWAFLFLDCGLFGRRKRSGEPGIMSLEALSEVEERHSTEAIEAEIQRFEERVQQLHSGEITAEQFRPFRLKHGTYGQRQPGFQMLRVKIAAGVLKPDQLRVLAGIADDYSTGRGHLTTRENVQFHFVKLENVPATMRRLAAAGLTTRDQDCVLRLRRRRQLRGGRNPRRGPDRAGARRQRHGTSRVQGPSWRRIGKFAHGSGGSR